MPAVPKRKHSKRRKNNRRSHDALKLPVLVKDPKTGHMVLPHRVNPNTGEYKGKKVVKVD